MLIVSGSDLMVKENITVNFFKAANSFSRSPFGRTCGCVLEVPDAYENYADFRSEFNSVLDAKVWVMDII